MLFGKCDHQQDSGRVFSRPPGIPHAGTAKKRSTIFDALPSSLTGISFLSRLILHAEPGKPDNCFHSFFFTTAFTVI